MSDTQSVPLRVTLRWTHDSFTVDMVHVTIAPSMTWLFVAMTPAMT